MVGSEQEECKASGKDRVRERITLDAACVVLLQQPVLGGTENGHGSQLVGEGVVPGADGRQGNAAERREHVRLNTLALAV